MENRRRLTRRQYSQTQRSLGLNASQVLHCGDLQREAFQYINLAVAFHPVDIVISLVFLIAGLSSWLRYVHLNYYGPFLPVNVPVVGQIDQYTIANQNEATFPLLFGRISKNDATRVFQLLNLPHRLIASNNFSFLSESGFLIFLK